jgi:hypothetical protein
MKKVAWLLVPVALLAPASMLLVSGSGCGNATDCPRLGACGGGGAGGNTTGSGGTGGTGTTTGAAGATTTSTSTTSTSTSTTSTSTSTTSAAFLCPSTPTSAGPPGVCLESRFGGGPSSVDQARAVWVDGAGDVILAGDFQGNLTIAGGTVSSAGHGAFIASMD